MARDIPASTPPATAPAKRDMRGCTCDVFFFFGFVVVGNVTEVEDMVAVDILKFQV